MWCLYVLWKYIDLLLYLSLILLISFKCVLLSSWGFGTYISFLVVELSGFNVMAYFITLV